MFAIMPTDAPAFAHALLPGSLTPELRCARSAFVPTGALAPRRALQRRALARCNPRMAVLTRETAQGTVKRVVVTGTGVVSCFGTDSDEFYQALLDGKSGARQITQFDVDGWKTDFAAYIDPEQVKAEEYVAPKMLRRLDPFLAYALVAAHKALQDAGIALDSDAFKAIDKSRAGVLCGSGMGGLNIYSEGVEKLISKGHNRMSPFFIPYAITNMVRTTLIILVFFCR